MKCFVNLKLLNWHMFALCEILVHRNDDILRDRTNQVYYRYCCSLVHISTNLSVPDGYSKNFNIYVFITITEVDTSAGGLLVPEGIIRPVVSASALIRFIRDIF